MKIKSILILFFLSYGFVNSYGQTYKFISTGYSVSEKGSTGKWSKWSDLKKTSVVISFDNSKNRIIIYSQEIQLYDILKYEEKTETDTDLVYPFICMNDDGEPFTISIITRKNQDNRKQLYLNQKDVMIVYNIENFTEKEKK